MACVLVGHVTKDGAIAGPRVLEHLVDVVLQFEGDRHSTLRTIRGVKNRYGPSDEVGCFQMVARRHRRAGRPVGDVPDPTRRRRCRAPARRSPCRAGGRCPAELQALITPERRRSQPAHRVRPGFGPGGDGDRGAAAWGGVALGGKDVLAATVGGAKMTEPAADLPLALAIWSSARDIPLAPGLVVIGELGLAADVRPVGGVPRRLAEAARLGFDHAWCRQAVGAERPEGHAGGRGSQPGRRLPWLVAGAER